MKLTTAQRDVLSALSEGAALVPHEVRWRIETPDAGWGLVRRNTILALWNRDLVQLSAGDVYTITPAGLAALREGRDAD